MGGRLLGEYFGGSNTFFIHTTALGSTDQVTGQTGTVQEDTLLYPWGQPWKQVEPPFCIPCWLWGVSSRD